MTTLEVSIVIPTYNGGKEFAECLETIYRQKTTYPYEVICIDSGSTDGTPDVCKQYKVRLYQIDKKEFNHGLTRNFGIQLAQGKYVVLITQDAIPADEHWLAHMIETFVDEQVAGVYCRQIPRPDADVLTKQHLNRWLTGRLEKRINFIQDRTEYEKLSPMEKYKFCNFDDVCSCIRKSVWEKIPYEKTEFAEDLFWSKKVIEAGYKIVYEPKAAVVHSHNRSARYEYKRTYICHRKLYELFQLQTVPALKYVIRFFLFGLLQNYSYVYKEEKDPIKRWNMYFRLPLLGFLGVYAQYKGALDQKNNKPLKTLKGV